MEAKILDLTDALKDKFIKEVILHFDNLSPEEQLMLLEEYCEKYRAMLEYSDIREM